MTIADTSYNVYAWLYTFFENKVPELWLLPIVIVMSVFSSRGMCCYFLLLDDHCECMQNFGLQATQVL